MKYLFNFCLALFCATLITSCAGGSGSSFHGVPADLAGYTMSSLEGTDAKIAQKVDGNGKVLESGAVQGGSKSGQWVTYNDEGKIVGIVNYIDGMKNGEELKLNKRGQIEARTAYLNNQLHGMSGTYKNGRSVQESSYLNGQLDGPTFKYFNNGKLQQEINFKNGKQDGALKYYDEDGNVTLEYVYKNGEKISGGIVEK